MAFSVSVGCFSVKATPEVEPAVALAAAQVSMGAGEEPESGRERGYYQR